MCVSQYPNAFLCAVFSQSTLIALTGIVALLLLLGYSCGVKGLDFDFEVQEMYFATIRLSVLI